MPACAGALARWPRRRCTPTAPLRIRRPPTAAALPSRRQRAGAPDRGEPLLPRQGRPERSHAATRPPCQGRYTCCRRFRIGRPRFHAAGQTDAFHKSAAVRTCASGRRRPDRDRRGRFAGAGQACTPSRIDGIAAVARPAPKTTIVRRRPSAASVNERGAAGGDQRRWPGEHPPTIRSDPSDPTAAAAFRGTQTACDYPCGEENLAPKDCARELWEWPRAGHPILW